MKKTVSLILALALCLSLCACGNNTGAVESSVETTAEIDPLAFLYGNGGIWRDIALGFDVNFNEDGTGHSPYEGDFTWAFSNGNLTTSSEQYEAFQLLNVAGVDYLVGEKQTLIRKENVNNIPVATVSLTVDNWKAYFEINSTKTEVKDQFGELTGEIEFRVYLSLKDRYRFVYNEENILMRLAINGITIDKSSENGWFEFYASDFNGKDLDLEALAAITIDQIEMIKIEGTITYLDGI